MVLTEEDMTEEKLLIKITELYEKREFYIKNMEKSGANDAAGEIIKLINKYGR